MRTKLKTMMFRKLVTTTSSSTMYNPFVKKGDIILVKGKPGKFRVIETDEEKIKVADVKSTKEEILVFDWQEFAGWRSGSHL